MPRGARLRRKLGRNAASIHPAVRRRQRHRYCRAPDRRTAQREVGQAGRDREPAGRRRPCRDQRLHLGQRRPRAALCIERVVPRASLHAGETALRSRARSRADRAGDRHLLSVSVPAADRISRPSPISSRRARSTGEIQCRGRRGLAGVHGRCVPQEPRISRSPRCPIATWCRPAATWEDRIQFLLSSFAVVRPLAGGRQGPHRGAAGAQALPPTHAGIPSVPRGGFPGAVRNHLGPLRARGHAAPRCASRSAPTSSLRPRSRDAEQIVASGQVMPAGAPPSSRPRSSSRPRPLPASPDPRHGAQTNS